MPSVHANLKDLTSGQAAALCGYTRAHFLKSIYPKSAVLREAAYETDGGHLRIPRSAVMAYRAAKSVCGKNPVRFEGEADRRSRRMAELFMEMVELIQEEPATCRSCRERAARKLAAAEREAEVA